MNTLLITGGAGFIGSHFVRQVLTRTNTRAVVFDKLTYAGNPENLSDVRASLRFAFVHADISDAAAVQRAFEEYRPEAVVNFAAESHVDRSIDGPRPFVDTNVVGTLVLLEAARAYWQTLNAEDKKAFRFLQISTDEVYGSLGATGFFTEETPYAPNSPYAASKAAADHFVRAYFHTYGLPTLITNCSNNYGPYQFPEKLIPLIILNAIEKKPLPIYGDGLNVRDWIHVNDHCDGIARVLAQGRAGEQYNLGGASERTNVQVVGTICDALQALRPFEGRYADLKTFVKDRPGHDRRYAIDSTKAQHELGWSPQHPFEEGIRQTVQWYLNHLDWCERVQSGKYRRERRGLGES